MFPPLVDQVAPGKDANPTATVTWDESQDCVGGLLERGPLVAFFDIYFVVISLVRGLWGRSKPLMYLVGQRVDLEYTNHGLQTTG